MCWEMEGVMHVHLYEFLLLHNCTFLKKDKSRMRDIVTYLHFICRGDGAVGQSVRPAGVRLGVRILDAKDMS